MKLKSLLLPLFTFSLSIGINSQNSYRIIKPEVIISQKIDATNDYYSSISDSLSGDALLNALHNLNSSKRKRTVSYNGMRTFAKTCDADPNGSGKILGFYDNKLVGPNWDGGDTWNREHVWPNSRGGNQVEDDAYVIRPASTSTNSDRGNDFFSFSAYDPGKTVAEYRGIAARIVFYSAIADTSLTLVDKASDNSANHTMGKLSDLLKWNLQYQPEDLKNSSVAIKAEINRNDIIQNNSSGQGNRNPFVDHPEYACKIWGNTNETTKAICSGNFDPETSKNLTGLTYSGNAKKMTYKAGENFDPTGLTIIASFDDRTTKDVTKEVKWTPSPFKAGSTYVKGSYTFNNIMKVVTINGIKIEGKKVGCGGSIIATSSLVSIISLAGIMLLKKRKK